MYLLTNMNWKFFIGWLILYSLSRYRLFFSNPATSKAKTENLWRQKALCIVFGLMNLQFSQGDWIITKTEMSHKHNIYKFFQRIWKERTFPNFFYEASITLLPNQVWYLDTKSDPRTLPENKITGQSFLWI